MLRPRLLSRPAAAPGGVWQLADDPAAPPVVRQEGAMDRAIVLVPTEAVLLLAVDLPLPGLRQRLEALPFAVEDRVGTPLASVHTALGQDLAPRRYLAGVVAHDRVEAWVAQLAGAGLDDAALVPDVLAMPRPLAGWRVERQGERVLVRTAEGPGFAVAAADLADAWALAGEPAVEVQGAGAIGLPGAVPAGASPGPPLPPPLDLRQGRYAVRRRGSAAWRRIAAVALIGLAAHALIATADTAALAQLAARHTATARSLLASAAPDADAGEDLATAAAALVPAGLGGSDFLPLLARVGTALRGLPTPVTLRSISFDASGPTMSIEVDAPDMATLNRVGGALTGAGLSAQVGASATENGRAIGSFLVKGA